tara:strand:- start:14132 stop:14860 length:729 start_codon:yes stop_codon:yes gene_type:complete
MGSILSYTVLWDSMEQLAPRLASATKVIGSITLVALLINLQLDIFEQGISIIDYTGAGVVLTCFTISYFASRERKITKLTGNLSLEEQLAALETTPTKSGENNSIALSQSIHTQAIIESIVGGNNDINQQQVDSAISTLSTGEIGASSQSIAEQLPAPHQYSSDIIDSTTTPVPETTETTKPNVPLPKIEPDLVLDTNVKENQAAMNLPDLDDLFDEPTAVESNRAEAYIDTPALPDLDDLI